VIAAEDTGPRNLRVYGVLLRAGRVLMSAEHVAGRDILKFPGGGVEPGETPEAALAREFREESGLDIALVSLLHVPGTLFSPWTLAPYTPIYYRVAGDGEPLAPDHEPLTLSFMTPEDAIRSTRMAEPEIEALRRALVVQI
jgi:8-oxo-dGTP diphosphatase